MEGLSVKSTLPLQIMRQNSIALFEETSRETLQRAFTGEASGGFCKRISQKDVSAAGISRRDLTNREIFFTGAYSLVSWSDWDDTWERLPLKGWQCLPWLLQRVSSKTKKRWVCLCICV